jgi:hypothetical protein
MKNLIKVYLLLALSLASFGHALNCQELQDSTMTLVVDPFSDRSSGMLAQGLVRGMNEQATASLVGRVRARILESRGSQDSANMMTLKGSVTQGQGVVRLDLRLIEAKSQKILCAVSESVLSERVERLLMGALSQLLTDEDPNSANIASVESNIKPVRSSGTLRIQFKIANTFFNESPIPAQKVRIFVDGKMRQESEVVSKTEEKILLAELDLSPGLHRIELRHGLVSARGNWVRMWEIQPKPFEIVLDAQDIKNHFYKLKASDTKFVFEVE